jgi:hypothetical protein
MAQPRVNSKLSIEKSGMDVGRKRIGIGAIGERMGVHQKEFWPLEGLLLEGRVIGRVMAD